VIMENIQKTLETIRKKICSLSLITKRKVGGILVGDHKTKLLGHGLSFDQTREYQHGDDIRLIDWNAYARTQQLSTKQYKEERKQKICILFDVSRSSQIQTSEYSKGELSQTALSVLMLAGAHHQDEVSAIAYADSVVHRTQPKTSITGISADLELLLQLPNHYKDTCLSHAATEVTKRYKKNPLTLFVISDFVDQTIEKTLPMLSCLYDVCAIRTLDPIELQMPIMGILPVLDIETGMMHTLHSNGQKKLKELLLHRLEEQNKLFSRHNISVLDLRTDDTDPVTTMIRFFLARGRKS
jgi:uncharacterized protein (DUF58 family)